MFDGTRIGPSAGPLAAEAVWRPALRRAGVLLVLGLAWEGYGRWIDNDLVFPTLSATLAAFWRLTVSGELPARALASLEVLALGYGAGSPWPRCWCCSPSPAASAANCSRR